ncbi:hypothetical protein ABMY26_31845 [Azospirillum sp. HJ39]|uniref:hypothetical protein n=1 Tax=Azospirillum sp. HJ39 TaxID=3159496 RepID=UPI00355803DB
MTEIYTERLVAFVDILGWSSYCKRSAEADVVAVADLLQRQVIATEMMDRNRDLYSAYTKEKVRATPGILPNPLHQAVECSAFSDSIVLSMPASFGWRICGIGGLCRDLLQLGFLTRGAVTVGKLHHRNGMVFGPALVRAVELEKTAVFPRIVVDAEISKRGKGWPLGGSRPVIIDHLGRKVVNLFDGPSHHTLKGVRSWRSEVWRIGEIRKRLAQELRDCADNEHIAEKWRYMQRVLPRMLGPLRDRLLDPTPPCSECASNVS